jgi:hypothetical protein
MRKIDWLLVGGIVLTVWAVTNTYLDIARYGVDQGFYWWFCNLALMGTAYGLLRKHRGWLIGFLSISCYTQIFWILDNLARVFIGENLFGLVEFMYHPGLPVDEFLLSHYHYVTIPATLWALVHLPAQPSNALKLISIFNPVIFGVSYFFFPKEQNVNCIHEPCFAGTKGWDTPLYSVLFWLAIFVPHLFIGRQLERFFSRRRFTPEQVALSNKAAIAVMVGCVALAGWDTRYKLSLPQFRCVKGETGSPVEASCRFTLDFEPEVMLLAYKMENRTGEPQVCSSKLIVEGKEIGLDENIALRPNETQYLKTEVPYPSRSVTASLGADCTPNRRNASEPQ